MMMGFRAETKAIKTSLLLCVCAACSSSPPTADTSEPIVLDCSDGLASCTNDAIAICGKRGYDEIDRMRDGFVTSGGRLEQQDAGRHVYREDTRFEETQQTLVIRCR